MLRRCRRKWSSFIERIHGKPDDWTPDPPKYEPRVHPHTYIDRAQCLKELWDEIEQISNLADPSRPGSGTYHIPGIGALRLRDVLHAAAYYLEQGETVREASDRVESSPAPKESNLMPEACGDDIDRIARYLRSVMDIVSFGLASGHLVLVAASHTRSHTILSQKQRRDTSRAMSMFHDGEGTPRVELPDGTESLTISFKYCADPLD